jgi:arabinose-5-phosphate isomerase
MGGGKGIECGNVARKFRKPSGRLKPEAPAPMALPSPTVLSRARACIRIEAAALGATARGLGPGFVATARAVEATIAAGRKLIFSGVGKSAHIAQKLCGTFNSTGASSCFLDATQALHGDLGLVDEGDLALLLSNSGQTGEIVRLVPVLRRFGVKVAALTAHPDSDLGRAADHLLVYRVPREACPLRLAPTASTTAALALGDALAMVLLESRGLTREDFARYHPAGNLGMQLLLRVRDIMRTGERLPVARDNVTVQDAILRMTKAKSGSIALVAAKGGRLTGILTDGDFRRSALSGPGFLQERVARFMTRNPKVISQDALGVDALRLFEAHKIDDLIVIDAKGRPVGLVDGQDLPKLKIV